MRQPIIIGAAAERIGMDGKMAGAGVEQEGAVEAVIDGGGEATELGGNAPLWNGSWNPIVARFHHTADRLRAES